MNLVRLMGMALAGAALLAATAFSYQGARAAVHEPGPAVARLSASAMRTVTRQVFAKAKPSRTMNVACNAHNGHA